MRALPKAAWLLCLCLAHQLSLAQVPDTLNFQGRIADSAGDPITTTVDVTTKLYQDGLEVFSQTHPGVAVDSGVFSLDIGPLGNVTFDRPTQVGISVDGDPEIMPRTPLRSVPFSHSLKLPFVGRGNAPVNQGLVRLNVTGGGAGVQVDSSAGPGMTVEYAATDGLEVLEAASDGIQIDSAHSAGIRIGDTGSHGIHILSPSADGIRIDDAGDDGIDIPAAKDRGISIGLVGTPSAAAFANSGTGLEVVGAQTYGVFVGGAATTGVRVRQAGNPSAVGSTSGGGQGFAVDGAKYGLGVGRVDFDGVRIDSAGRYGYVVTQSENVGFMVWDAGNGSCTLCTYSGSPNGFEVVRSGGNGVWVGNVDKSGVVVDHAQEDGVKVLGASGYSLAVYGGKIGDQITDHIALIRNYSSDLSGPDVLALQVPNSSPGVNTNFITFYNGSESVLGAIEGAGGGAIQLTTPGGDYAEYLPRLNLSDSMNGGDVVGLYGGRISFQTNGADKVMAITDQAAVVGRMPRDEDSSTVEPIGFVGQLRVKTWGPVKSGDFIVASGREDGTAIAVRPEDIHLAQLDQIIGRAWENSAPGLHRVTTAVGLDEAQLIRTIAQRQENQIEDLKRALDTYESRLARIEMQLQP